MPNIDVITSKLSAMSSYMEELSPYLVQVKIGKITVVSPEMHIIARLFQLIVDAAIDINTHIITRGNLESPDDYEGTFSILGKCGIISNELVFKISKSVGLRNKLVHGYEKVDKGKVLSDITNGIGQYKEYMKNITDFMDKQERKV